MPKELEGLATNIRLRAALYIRWALFYKSSVNARGRYKKRPRHILHNICRMIAFKFDGAQIDERMHYQSLSRNTGVAPPILRILELEVLDAIQWQVRFL